MPEQNQIPLGGSSHTMYSDEVWWLVLVPGSAEVIIESRFDTDAPARTGYPDWIATEFCTSRDDGNAVCQIHYSDVAHVLSASRLSFVPESIWAKALEECSKLPPGTTAW